MTTPPDGISWRDYVAIDARLAALDERVTALDRRVCEAAAAQDKLAETTARTTTLALDKASAAIEKRLDALNELRSMVKDREAAMATRESLDAQIALVSAEVRANRERLGLIEGKGAGVSLAWAVFAGAVGVAATLIGVVLALQGLR